MSKLSNAVALVSDEVQKLIRVNRVQAKIVLHWSFIVEVAIILSAFYGDRHSTDPSLLNRTYKKYVFLT